MTNAGLKNHPALSRSIAVNGFRRYRVGKPDPWRDRMEERAFREAARALLFQRSPHYARLDTIFNLTVVVLGSLWFAFAVVISCVKHGHIILPTEFYHWFLIIGGIVVACLFLCRWWWRKVLDRTVRASFTNADFEAITQSVAEQFGRHT